MSRAAAQLRRDNERLVLEHLRARGAASRAVLAKDTGLSAPTVGKVVDDLVTGGLVEDAFDTRSTAGGGEAAMGRPARPVRLNRADRCVLALQIGVRRTRLARLPVAGPDPEDSEHRWPVQFDSPRRARTWITRLGEAARELPSTGVRVVTVSVPGVVDEAQRRVLLSPNLHWLAETDLVAPLERLWSAPVMLVQEIRALALGHLASQRELRDFVLVDVGEGVGGAVVIGGRLQHGATPLSGEIGHTPVPGNPRRCGCGARGCVETLASRQGLLQSWREHTGRPRGTWRQLDAHLRQGGVEPWLEATWEALAASVAGAMNVLGLRRAVLTGAIAEMPRAVTARLARAVERSAMWSRFGEVTCEIAPRRRAAGLVIAALDRVLLPPLNTGPAPARASR